MFGFTTTQQIASNAPKQTGGGIASGIGGFLTNGLGSFLNKAIAGNVNKPEYKPEYYINTDALFPNGVTDYTTQTTTDSNGNVIASDNTLLYTGIGVGILALIFILKK